MHGSSPPHRRRLRQFAWSSGVFVVTLAVAGLALGAYARLLDAERDAAARRAHERIRTALQMQLQTIDGLLRSVEGLFLASEHVSDIEFAEMAEVLDARRHFLGLQALGFAARTLEDGRPHYRYTMIAPEAGNERLRGFDAASQAPNMAAIAESRDRDQPTMSGSFALVQTPLATPRREDGIVIRAPVYSPGPLPRTVAERRAREIGSIAVSFRVGELIRRALGGQLDPSWRVRIVDITDGAGDVLYDDGVPTSPDRVVTGRLRHGGRTWQLQLLPLATVDAGSIAVWLGGLGGLAMSAVLAVLVWTLVGRRDHALWRADRLSRRYRDSEARFRVLNELLPVAVVLSREDDDRIVQVNASGRRLLGLDTGVVDRYRLTDFADPEAHEDAVDRLGPLTARPLRSLDGRAFRATISEQRLELDGRALRLSVLSDISDLLELTETLRHQASHDALTGLINRRAFEERLEQALALPSADGHGLLYLDLDQFKLVNDVSGHLAGDALLGELGACLQAELGGDGVLARLGGDEFAALVVGDRGRVLAVAERLREATDRFAFDWQSSRYAITASIGAVLVPPGARVSTPELLSLADTACYLAKEAGRNRVHLFSDDDRASHRLQEMQWIGRLRAALDQDRLCLYYQELHPLDPTSGEQGAHFELLLRLRDESGALVLPGEFVPAAERFGLMPLLDRWVVSTALAHFARLHPCGAEVALCAINLSATTMEDDAFPAFVLDQLQRSGVPAERLCFEVTETAAVANMARVVALIDRLRGLGCRFALDDFGAGMSSFGYLKNLPVDYIKIDGSFIRTIESDPMSHSIVRAVTDIGHQMGAGVIAEFVNSRRTVELLRELGVDYAQGYMFHQPEPAGVEAVVA